MKIINLINKKMEQIGWNQTDLSKATNIPRQHISSMLGGNKPIGVTHMLVFDCALKLGLDYGDLTVGK